MKIHHRIPDDAQYRAKRSERPLVVAIGFFDGFHRGHQAIVRALLAERRPGSRTAILTFRNHPATVLRPDAVPPMIATLEERVNAIAAAGIDELFLIPFDPSIATLAPETFIDDMLVERIGAQSVIVGENFRFGAKRRGDIALARERLEHRGRRFVAVANDRDAGERISSTRIRGAILAGELDLADRLLGGAYTIAGRVELGEGRGHDLGFPTANLAIAPEKVLPKDGVYAAVARLDGNDHAALVSIGTNPTFNGSRRTVEAWLRDFRGGIYGAMLALRDVRFVREQVRFANMDELREQMLADVGAVAYPRLQI